MDFLLMTLKKNLLRKINSSEIIIRKENTLSLRDFFEKKSII